MPASGKTPNFNLPLYRPIDTVSALVTFNGAMSTIDSELQNIKTTADTGSTDISDLQTQLNDLQNELGVLKTQLNNFPSSFPVTNITSKWTNAPGTSFIKYSIYTDNHMIKISLQANVSNNATTKIPLTSKDNCIIMATCPDNVFNIEEGHFVKLGFGTKLAGNTTANIELYAIRQNSITSIGIPLSTDGPDGYAYLDLVVFNKNHSAFELP